ncbi:MAG: mononuclear molybdenum enzyme YedY, partial [Methylococcaceae bacterium]|nr:mononuclear molybdenum enzyme YedY [Methylococcaceae bacterium]
MRKPQFPRIPSSEITPPEWCRQRRRFIRLMSAGSLAIPFSRAWAGEKLAASRPEAYRLAEELTPLNDVTQYNNFYEFGTDKESPARTAGSLKTRPWTVTVEGEVRKPKVFDLDDLLKLAALEERVYRLRCVEAWSMVIPWVGYPLAELLKRVEPTG